MPYPSFTITLKTISFSSIILETPILFHPIPCNHRFSCEFPQAVAYTSDLPHYTSDLPHSTSDLPHYTSALPHHTSALPHYTSDLPHHTSAFPQQILSATLQFVLE